MDFGFDLAELERSRNGHSIFAPSFSAAWIWCSGSLIPNLLENDSAGEDAAIGTVAHSIGEQWLKSGERPDHLIGTVEHIDEGDEIFSIAIDKVMLDYVERYVDWCEMLPGDHFVEQRVYFSRLTPIKKQGGTADHFALSPGLMVITDLKFGKGVPVYAAEDLDDPRAIIGDLDDIEAIRLNGNTQGLLYALGVFFKHDAKYHFDKICIRIAQPRLDNFDEWWTTREELLRFAEYVKIRAAAAWELNAPRRASAKGCMWCRVKTTCAAYLKLMNDLVDDCFDDLTAEVDASQMQEAIDRLEQHEMISLTNPGNLTTVQMAKVFLYRSLFEKWFSEMEKELESRANEGERVPLHKLVESRSNRVWKGEKEAVDAVEEQGVSSLELYTVKMASPAQAEDLLVEHGIKRAEAKKIIAQAALKPPGKPTLVPETDKRRALVDPADEIFDDLTDDEL
jgi:hypothetical protein